MEKSCNVVNLHPQFLDILFAFKSKINLVFRDIKGIHEIDHFSLNQINQYKQLITLSSTPALEFNLFNSNLWRYDCSYAQSWFQQCTQDSWQNLYCKERYDELYYLKQIKHNYQLGLTISAKNKEDYLVFSFASRKSCKHTRELFFSQHADFYKIGEYCFNKLNSLLSSFNNYSECKFPSQVKYEISK